MNRYASIDDLEDRWVKHLQPFFGHMAAAKVTTDLCKRYIVQRQESGVADSTINRTLAALKRMFHLATECTPPKVQFVPYIPMLKANNVRTGFVETEARVRREQACGRIGLWMLAVFEVGCTYGWRHGSLLKMRVKQTDANANVIRLEPGTTKNKKGSGGHNAPPCAGVADPVHQRQKVRRLLIHTRKWQAGERLPRKLGESMQ
jgi:integrase